ncbi:LOW QUALITY PROTEIN: tetratricopeptide repeat protein 12 [Tachyglossus aculeatus]|uniref:LOW QUALITY PROTEIN: tetratricopeptide repeat protein 12 n=1 Tax=Tachyglossus aculeatus TaxID=9261 RepID=UPI0018F469D9|nr:LOW QUALITY PROTEIN: tetratricopeptide repeat protein 12 [Tachyglossus aculeatus]
MAEERDLQKFLQNVDEITNLIQGLRAEDPAEREKAISATEQRLQQAAPNSEECDGCRVVLNRTAISPPQAPQSAPIQMPQTGNSSHPDAFLAVLGQDARERARRRKENKALANALKEQGNEAFAKGNYEMAIQRYSEGLEKLKDMQVLYTNRAQAYLKLQEYPKALLDCEWALKCGEKCPKAHFLMARAHLARGDYNESRQCYRKMLESNPSLEKQVAGYLEHVALQEKAALQEQEAQEELASGKSMAVATKTLLQTLTQPDQLPFFYAGGTEALAELMRDCTEQTLFRTNNGFSIINDNKVIKRCLSTAGDSGPEEAVCLSVTKLWHAVCRGNEVNQHRLVTHSGMGALLPSLLLGRGRPVQQQIVALLTLLAETETGRNLLLSHVDLQSLLQALVTFVNSSDVRAGEAMRLLTDLALEDRFKAWFRNHLSTALPILMGTLRNPAPANQATLSQCLAIVGNLSADATIRSQLAACPDLWDICLELLLRWEEDLALVQGTMYAALGLLMNLLLEPASVPEGRAAVVNRRCVALLGCEDGGILTRAAGVLSRSLPASPPASVEEAVVGGVVKKMIQFLKAGGQTAPRYATKTLAICTKSSLRAREEVVRLDKRLRVLSRLLDSEDEVVVGNAALCFGVCVEVAGVAASLLHSDIVDLLLRHVSRAGPATVSHNAAIALGKLCTAEPRHVVRLRELHGVEILHGAMKHVSGP